METQNTIQRIHYNNYHNKLNTHKHFSSGDLRICTDDSDTFMRVQNNKLATEGGKSAVLLFFKSTYKKKFNPSEEKISINNYLTDGGIKIKKERFRDSRDFIKKTDKLQTTMTCFKPKPNEYNKLTIKVTEGNEVDIRNHANTCSDRLVKKERDKDYCHTNSNINNTNSQSNKGCLTIKNLSDLLKIQTKKHEYVVPKVMKKTKRELTEGSEKFNRIRNEKSEPRVHSEENYTLNNNTKRKKKIIEELMIRNEKTAIIDLQEHLIKETNKQLFKNIEKKMNKLKENDISINLNIDKIEDNEQEDDNNNNNNNDHDKLNINNNTDDNGEENKENAIDTQLNKSYKVSQSQHGLTFKKDAIYNHVLLKSTNAKCYSKSHREMGLKKIIMKPRVDVNEYITEISKYQSHQKSHSTFINTHNKLTSYQDTNCNAITIINDNNDNNDNYNPISHHVKSKSVHLKKIKTNNLIRNDVNNGDNSNDDIIHYQKSKNRLEISPLEFNELLINKVVQVKQKNFGHNKQNQEKIIAKYVELLKLQEAINTQRDKGRKKRKPKLVLNEYFIGKRNLESRRSASQSTIIEPNDYYTSIIPTKEILGVDLKENHNTSVYSISKGDYDHFISNKEEQVKKGMIGNSDKDIIQKEKIIKLLKKLEKSNSSKSEEKKEKEKENNNDSIDLSSKSLSKEFLDKIHKTLMQADTLLFNSNIEELLNDKEKDNFNELKQLKERNNRELEMKIQIKKEEIITEEDEDLIIQTTDKEPVLTYPNITIGSKEENSEAVISNKISDKSKSNNYITETPKSKQIDINNKNINSEDQIQNIHNDNIIKDHKQEEKEHKSQITEEPIINEEILLTNKQDEEVKHQTTPKELELIKNKEEEAKVDDEQLKEIKLKIYKDIFPNLSEWYIFFIKRNIMINIVKYANIRTLYKSGLEMIVEIIKREPYYRINYCYKYQLYLLILRGCFNHYLKHAFNKIKYYTNRTKDFVSRLDILIKFISLERIQLYGDIKEHLEIQMEENEEVIQGDNNEDYAQKITKQKKNEDHSNYNEDQAHSSKYKSKNSISNEIIPEINDSNLNESAIYYQKEYLHYFIAAINIVFVLPAACSGLQKIYDYAFRDELSIEEEQEQEREKNINTNNNNNQKSTTNQLTKDIINRKLDVNSQMNNNQSMHSLKHNNTYLYESFEEKSNKEIHPNSEDSDCLHRAFELLKYQRDQLSNQSSRINVSNDSFLNNRSQKSYRNIDISMINQSLLSQHAYSQRSNKNIISLNDLSKQKPGIRLKMRLDNMKTPSRKTENVNSNTPKSNNNSIHNTSLHNNQDNDINDNIAYHKRSTDKTFTVSEYDISADKDMASAIDWDYIISNNNRTNSGNSQIIFEENINTESLKNTNEGGVVTDKCDNSENDTVNVVPDILNKKKEEVKISDSVEEKSDEQMDKKNTDDFIEINVEEIDENISNNNSLNSQKNKQLLSNTKVNSALDNKVKYNNSLEEEDNSQNIIIEVNDNCKVIIIDDNKFVDKINENNNTPLTPKAIEEEENSWIHNKIMSKQSIILSQNISDELINEITINIVNDIIQKEIEETKSILPLKKPLLPFFDGLGYLIPTNFFSVFLRTVSEVSKESTLNFYDNRIAPLIFDFIKQEVEKNYSEIYNKMTIPLNPDPNLLMNSYLLQDEKMRKQSKGKVSEENKTFISKTILNTINEFSLTRRNEYSPSFIDISNYLVLNECLIDASNEIIEKNRIYGQIGEPLPWSLRSRDVSFKYDLSHHSMHKLQDTVITELNKLISMKMALIGSNHEDMDHEQLAQDRENKFIESIRQELMDEDYIWKSLEGEETDVKIIIVKIIIEQLLNEIVEIMEHVHFSRREPAKYQHKSIYACEDIPRLSFQNTTENELEFNN